MPGAKQAMLPRDAVTGHPVRTGVLRTLGLAVLGVMVITVLQQPLTLASGYATVWIYGGLAAAGVSMAPRGWVGPVIAAVALATGWSAWALGYSWWIVLLRMAADVAAVAIAGLALRRHASSASALGRDWLTSSAAILLAGATRIALLWPTAESSETAYPANASTLGSLAIATILGIAIGQVLGACVRDRRSLAPTTRERRILVGLLVSAVAFLAITAVLPAQVDRYASPLILDAPIVILAAFALGYNATALIASFLVVGQGALLAQGLGVYRDIQEPAEIVGYQVSLMASAVFMFVFAAAMQGRRDEEQAVIAVSRLSNATFDRSPVPTARVHGDSDIVIAANDALAALAWRPIADIIGRPLASALPPERGSFTDAARDRGYAELLVCDRVGNQSWVRASRSGVDDDGDMDVLVLVDITAERMSEELMRRQSRSDALTRLPNRMAALDHLTLALEGARPGCGVGVLLVDIDRLRRVNDTLGRPAGDAVIEAVGRIITRVTAGRGGVGRSGDDEFLVTIPEILQASDLEAVTAGILAGLARPLVVEGTELVVSVTMGGTVVESSDSIEAVLRVAGSALALAKSRARGTALVLPSDASVQFAPDVLAVERELRSAISSGHLVVHYQCLVDAATHDIRGAEALVRLQRDDGTVVGPAAFLPLAFELGLARELTWRVLTDAVRDAAGWQAPGESLTIAVNVPPSWLADADVDRVRMLLSDAGLPPTALTLELTEDELIDDGTGTVRLRMEQLRALGIRIAMDDFGTGYAGLESFRSLPVDVVKIDQSFIAPLAFRSPDDEELVASIIRLIHRFDRQAIAEGVETAEQAGVLKALGCDLLQGYRFGRPVPAEDFGAELARSRALGGSHAESGPAGPDDAQRWQAAHQ